MLIVVFELNDEIVFGLFLIIFVLFDPMIVVSKTELGFLLEFCFE